MAYLKELGPECEGNAYKLRWFMGEAPLLEAVDNS